MHGGKGADWYGMPGGRFSLGRLQEGSGYCVGAVVSTGMGVGDEGSSDDAQGGLAGNGMRDVWVLGEGWFRGVNGVFDVSCGLSSSILFQRIHLTYFVLSSLNTRRSGSEHIEFPSYEPFHYLLSELINYTCSLRMSAS